jgi:hypothetical protein
VTVGDHICIPHNDKFYHLEVGHRYPGPHTHYTDAFHEFISLSGRTTLSRKCASWHCVWRRGWDVMRLSRPLLGPSL